MSDAEMTGAAIGTGLGLMFIGMLWFFPFVGGLLLGMVLKKSKVVEDGPESLRDEKSATPFYLNKWVLSIGVFLIGYAVLLDDKSTNGSESSKNTNQEVENKFRFYAVGETATIGDLEVRLENWELKPTVNTGNQFTNLKRVEGSQYLILTITYKNISSQTTTLSDSGKVHLVMGDNEYVYDKNENILKDGWDILYKKIGPLNTLKTKLVFKIPDEKGIDLYWKPLRRYPDEIFSLR